MTQVTIQAVSKTQGTKSQMHQLDDAKLEEAIKNIKLDRYLMFMMLHTVRNTGMR